MSAIKIMFLCLLLIAISDTTFYNGSTNAFCIETERQALMQFKKDLVDDSNRLISWTGDGDCCKWTGVVCNNVTGHVTELLLQNPHADLWYKLYAEYEVYERSMLKGKINRSLLQLKHLIHLDLSFNDFGQSHIPAFLGSMTSLSVLNLSHAAFSGMIPSQIGNLTNLRCLDLGRNYVYAENLQWLSSLSLLEHLDLSWANVTDTLDGLEVTNKTLPFLVELHLSGCVLPQTSTSLAFVNFSSLSVLDLSWNYFDNSIIIIWVSGLKNSLISLRHLDLSENDFNSSVLNELYSFKNLEYLDLRFNNFQDPILVGLQNLTSLRYLDLSYNDFNSSIPNELYSSRNLEHLDLSFNDLRGPILTGLQNLTSLRHLCLSSNNFNFSIPNELFSFRNLEYFDLSYNNFQGPIPASVQNMTSLTTLRLSSNNLEIDSNTLKSMENLCNLISLDLSNNKLNQEIAYIFQILSKCISSGLEELYLRQTQLFGSVTNLHLEPFGSLAYLDLSYNSLEGVVSEVHFVNLTRLQSFIANGNPVKLNVSSNWKPPFQLESLDLGHWHIGPEFPLWLCSQRNLRYLYMSNTRISDVIPLCFWNFSSQLYDLNLSNNQIHGQLPTILSFGHIGTIDLSSNRFKGQLPHVSSYAFVLDLSNNAFSGSISYFLCYQMNESMNLGILNLGNNLLSGDIPDCWTKWRRLTVIQLNDNNFNGSIPSSIGDLNFLQLLRLRNNSFSGEIPSSLKNCTELVAIDSSENQFHGKIQPWIGRRLSSLVILNFRSNGFYGNIPVELCGLIALHILDLAHNNLSGVIPQCVYNFSAMSSANNEEGIYITFYARIFDMQLIIKGELLEYSTILFLVRSIDLSSNYLSGEIPAIVTCLARLQSLNLSHNLFTGRIPRDIGTMEALESLDFSVNQLSGEIPQSISSLTFLSHLNLSNNNLKGKIPLSTQIRGFDASCFAGNQLCGLPLTKSCNGNDDVPTHGKGDHVGGGNNGGEHHVDWFHLSMAYGFVVGFWGVLGPLLLNKKWRSAYSQFLDRLGHKIMYFCC